MSSAPKRFLVYRTQLYSLCFSISHFPMENRNESTDGREPSALSHLYQFGLHSRKRALTMEMSGAAKARDEIKLGNKLRGTRL